MSIASEITRINNNIAAAYSACENKGADMPQQQNSANLAAAIDSISIGDETVDSKVRFYDIDGKLLREYTEEKAMELTTLPDMPVHEGLDALSWSWTLQDIQTELAAYHCCIAVGCFYKTSDNKTKIHISLENSDTFSFVLIQSGENQAQIDWGDGSAPETLSVIYATGNNRKGYKATHRYSPSAYPADYTISISLIGDGWYGFGANNYNNLSICNGDPNYGKMIRRIYLANDASVDGTAFYYATGVEVITLTDKQVYGTRNKYGYCSALKFAIARGVIRDRCFMGCFSLRSVSFCKGISSVENSAFEQCFALENCLTLSDCQSIGSSAFQSCYSIKGNIALSACTNVGTSAFEGDFNISAVTLPSISYLYRGAFYCSGNTASLLEVDLTAFHDPDTLPALQRSVSDIFSLSNRYGRKPRLYVADEEMKTAFSNAANWAAGADYYVVKEAEE